MLWCAIMISSSLATTWWIDIMYNKRKKYDLSSFKITTLEPRENYVWYVLKFSNL